MMKDLSTFKTDVYSFQIILSQKNKTKKKNYNHHKVWRWLDARTYKRNNWTNLTYE